MFYKKYMTSQCLNVTRTGNKHPSFTKPEITQRYLTQNAVRKHVLQINPGIYYRSKNWF